MNTGSKLSRVEINLSDKTLTAVISGDVDHHNLQDIRGKIDYAIETSSARNIILDLSAVPFCDSSVIGLILGRKRLADRLGAAVIIRAPNPYVMKIIKLSGLSDMVEQAAKQAEQLAS
ncbi:MAG: anti-sigma factor antagonist [Oscillospiraceae bacterium]|jgi:stage II sporulation protein AA (anti-sigma F factor antagonist)|nr:anti-sigma factor antagonist [Oscillospiraceae bacterium]